MRALALLYSISLVACAGGGSDKHDVDAMTSNGDADPDPDGSATHGFGEPCTDNQQCDSGLCILVGTSGRCTKLCGDCPTGYGCLGVEGISIEGQVSFVCVPTSNQLCTTCTLDSECTLIGMDKCVTYLDGDRACARDCTDVACPTGYACQTVNIGGLNYQQCMAESGACDCSSTSSGAMQPCNIATPWNVCIGAQTCGGATGWGTCEPPSAMDDPDPQFVDSNCDGIDGDRTRAIFVSPAGTNSAGCGLVYGDPCQTIAFGISRATATSRPHVYLQAGTYTGSVTMTNGISIFGGYNFNWQRRPYSDGGHQVTISGGVTAISFSGITQPTWLDNVIVRSADASGTGASSIGVLVTSSSLVELRGVLVDPGAGGTGAPGADGIKGDDGGPAGNGNPGVEHSGFTGCKNRALPAVGTRGESTCGWYGGVGGTPGVGSGGGGQGGGSLGLPQAGGFGGPSRMNGQPGAAGYDAGDSAAGTGGSNLGSFSGFSYIPANGTNGVDGDHGYGGGGGGGGGGGTNNCDSSGSTGGGGGGGGCGGTLGYAGTGGGGSFGVIALDSTVAINSSIIKGGAGANGGRGGTGGAYGAGGTGGNGGQYGGVDEQDDGGMGAAGGPGGHGGRGGDGGGGGGGPSVALVCLGSSAAGVTLLGSTLTPSAAGAGGTSNAPGQPGLSAMTYGCQ